MKKPHHQNDPVLSSLFPFYSSLLRLFCLLLSNVHAISGDKICVVDICGHRDLLSYHKEYELGLCIRVLLAKDTMHRRNIFCCMYIYFVVSIVIVINNSKCGSRFYRVCGDPNVAAFHCKQGGRFQETQKKQKPKLIKTFGKFLLL